MRANSERGARLFGAPVIVIPCMSKNLNLWSTFDMGLLTQTILLAAYNYGVGSIIATSFVLHPDVLRKELEIPDDLQIVTGIGLGYPGVES